MDYKEKYNKLVEAVKVLQEANPSDDGIQNWVNDNVPELRESEDDRIRKGIIRNLEYLADRAEGFVKDELKERIAWLEKQGKANPYSGVSFEYNGHTWGMCARDNGVEILVDGEIKERVFLGNKPQGKSALETIKEEKVDNANYAKPTDKVEPKFKVGNWYQCTKDFFGKGVTFDKNTAYYCAEEGCLQDEYGCHIAIVKDLYDNFKLWTIEDASDGDVLYFSDETIVIFKDLYNATTFHSYCHIEDGIFNISKDDMPDWWEAEGFKPATKEQCGVLFQKMKESGYEWNNEKKELLEIEEELTDFEKSLKHIMIETLECGDTRNLKADAEMLLRLAQEPKEWSEEDEKNLTQCIEAIDACYKWDSMIDWLKSLRSRSRWKPSEEQMRALHDMNLTGNISYAGQGQVLMELYNDLKQLKKSFT